MRSSKPSNLMIASQQFPSVEINGFGATDRAMVVVNLKNFYVAPA